MGGAGPRPLMGGAGSWPSSGQGRVGRDVSKSGVGLCSRPVGCLACESQHRILQAVGWGQVSQPKMEKMSAANWS